MIDLMTKFIDLDELVPERTTLTLNGKEVFLNGAVTTEEMLEMQKIEAEMKKVNEEDTEHASESLELMVGFVKMFLIRSNPNTEADDFPLTMKQVYKLYELIVSNAMAGMELEEVDSPLVEEKKTRKKTGK